MHSLAQTRKSAADKIARNMRLGEVPAGSGPQQMYSALSMLNQARALVDPTKSLQQQRLSRGSFDGMVDELAQEKGEKYDFDALRKNPTSSAVGHGLAGAGVGGAVGYLGGGVKGAIGGAALGGAGGAGMGYLGAGSHNKKLLATAKILKEYGLLKPEYLRAALPLLKSAEA